MIGTNFLFDCYFCSIIGPYFWAFESMIGLCMDQIFLWTLCWHSGLPFEFTKGKPILIINLPLKPIKSYLTTLKRLFFICGFHFYFLKIAINCRNIILHQVSISKNQASISNFGLILWKSYSFLNIKAIWV